MISRLSSSSFIIATFLGTLVACSSSTKNSNAIFKKPADVQISNDYSSVRRLGNERAPAADEMSSNSLSGKPILTKQENFDWPVDRARFVRGFKPDGRRPHWGVDLAGPRGTSIYAAQNGTVIYVGREFHGYGKMILIESGYGWATLYAHLDKFYVQEGQKVAQGEVIGGMGASGRATGVHLHFEIRKDKGPVDPLLYLPGGTKVTSR